MSRNAWKQVEQGQITATTSGVDIPVVANLPGNTFQYAVTVTNTDASIVCHYVEPEGRGGTLTYGVPIPADDDAVSTFSPRDGADAISLGNPQVASASSTAVVNYRIYIQSRG